MASKRQMELARRAGWSSDWGEPPYRHAPPPLVDPKLGHNGIPRTAARLVASMAVGPPWSDVLAEHMRNNGFREGTRNRNPWTEEQGAGDAAYCAAASFMVPYHHGVRWWADAQFGEKGTAYSPFVEALGLRHGLWQYDHTSRGAPCDLMPSDIVTYDWNGDGIADHTETILASYSDLTFDTIGYNTGHPEGCWIPVRRDRKYLVGRLRLAGTIYGATAPPAGGFVPEFNPPIHIVGDIVSSLNLPEGVVQFTSTGHIYCWPGNLYRGAPVVDPAANWVVGGRQAARVESSPVPGKLYRCFDTAGEFYDY